MCNDCASVRVLELVLELKQFMEESMATVLEQLAVANDKADTLDGDLATLASAFTALASDVHAALAAAANPTADEQAALDHLSTTLDTTTAAATAALTNIAALNTDVGDADGDGNPAPTP